jgi:hypothetical protein
MVVHVSLDKYGREIPPTWYVVDLLCGLEVWTSRAKFRDSKKNHPPHWRGYKGAPVMRLGQLTRVHRKVTCLGCLAALSERGAEVKVVHTRPRVPDLLFHSTTGDFSSSACYTVPAPCGEVFWVSDEDRATIKRLAETSTYSGAPYYTRYWAGARDMQVLRADVVTEVAEEVTCLACLVMLP